MTTKEQPNEFVISFKTSAQISPDDWETIYPSLKVTRETTIGEIHNWFSGYSKSMMDVRLTELEIIQILEPKIKIDR